MVAIFHLLKFGMPTIEYPPMKDLLQFRGIPRMWNINLSFFDFYFDFFFHFVLQHQLGW